MTRWNLASRAIFAPGALMLAVLTACGTADDRLPHPVAVVFESPYLSVVGDVDVWVEGQPGRFSLGTEAGFDCDRPALITDDPNLSFTAVSARDFEWRGNLRLTEERCQRIKIDTRFMHSSVLALGFEETPKAVCLPTQMQADGNDDGILLRSFSFEDIFTDGMSEEERLHQLFLHAEQGDVYLRGVRQGDSPLILTASTIPPAPSGCETSLQLPGWWGAGTVVSFQVKTEATPGQVRQRIFVR